MKLITFTIEDTALVETFNELSFELYQHQEIDYASQTNRINAALFVKGYLLMTNTKCEARCILYQPNLLLIGQSVIFLGNFEAMNKESGAELLTQVISIFEKEYSSATLIGPVNGSTWNDYRIAIGDSNVLFPNDICAPSFYREVFMENGFEIFARYHTNLQTDLLQGKPFQSNDLTVAFFTKELFKEKLVEIYELTMEAFSKAPLFTSLSENKFVEKQMQLLPFLDMELLPFVLDKQCIIVGFALCYYGFEKDTLVVKTIARKAGREYAGIGRILSEAIIQIAKEKNVHKIFHAFMHEENTSNVLSSNLRGKPIKEYELYKLKMKG